MSPVMSQFLNAWLSLHVSPSTNLLGRLFGLKWSQEANNFTMANVPMPHPRQLLRSGWFCQYPNRTQSNNWITRRCPSCAARCKAVDPSSVVGWSLLAPHSMREWTMSRWPWWAARCTGEKTSPVSAAFLSAPASSNRRTGSTCPSNAAWCRGWRSTSSPRNVGSFHPGILGFTGQNWKPSCMVCSSYIGSVNSLG